MPTVDTTLTPRSLAISLNKKINKIGVVASVMYVCLSIGCITIGIFLGRLLWPSTTGLHYPSIDPIIFDENKAFFQPKSTTQITESLQQYMLPQSYSHGTSGDYPLIFYRDRGYYSITKSLVQHFLAIDQTNNLLQYKKDTNDCDDFSLMLMSHFHYSFQQVLTRDKNQQQQTIPLFGMVYGSANNRSQSHAFNAFYASPSSPDTYSDSHSSHSHSSHSQSQWYCIEPQNDTMVPCSNYLYHMYGFRLLLL